MSAHNNQPEEKLEELYAGLRSIAADSFPRHCPTCHRRFETAADFLSAATRPCYDSSGLRQSEDDDGQVLVEVFRNCPCGSTLVEVFRDRRDTSPKGLRRRRKFGQLLDMLTRQGVPRDTARTELLRLLSGEPSPLLAQHGFHFRPRQPKAAKRERQPAPA